METRPNPYTTQSPAEDVWVGCAVARFGNATFYDVLTSLLSDVDLDGLSEAIDEYGLEMVAEQALRALVDRGKLRADEAAASAEVDRILDADADASPTVHPVTVADLADEFTRLGLTSPATSCG